MVLPPSAPLAFVVSFLTMAALATVAILVEVPVRVRAIGVLMPPGGFFNVVAVEEGLVTRVHAVEGQAVSADQLLLEVTANGTNLPGETLPELKLRSLRQELALHDAAYRMARQIDQARLSAMREERDAAARRARIGQRRLEAHRDELGVREHRVTRLRELVEKGHIARDAFELEQATLMRTRADGAAFEQDAIGLEMEIRRLDQSMRVAETETELAATEHRLVAERLRRDIERGAYQVFQGIRAPADGVIARVLVAPGSSVRKGQVVAKLYQRDDSLEAWLYLSSSSARLLRAGQSVQLTLDAYPTEVFGTLTAIVSSVSGIALLPEEVSVPLALGGPVFEVRAALRQQHVQAYGSAWPLPPGTSFEADVIERRFRLYEWLFRSLVGRSDDAPF